MRDYSKVSAQFWVGKTGRALRGDMQTQVVAMYLMTSPHANMIGVYHCPIVYIAHETGSPIEGASKGLRRLCEEGFCTYDNENEMVWVHEMAKFQIGDELKPNDMRVKGLQKQFETLPESRLKQGFYEKYNAAFHLSCIEETKSPLQAPYKPHRSQEQEQEQEQKQEQEQESSPTLPIVDNSVVDDGPVTASEICQALKQIGIKHCNPKDSELIDALRQGMKGAQIVAVASEPKSAGKGIRWVVATLRGRLRDAEANQRQQTASTGKQWFETASGIEERGRQLGLTMKPGEQFTSFKSRVLEAAKLPMTSVRKAKLDAGLRP